MAWQTAAMVRRAGNPALVNVPSAGLELLSRQVDILEIRIKRPESLIAIDHRAVQIWRAGGGGGNLVNKPLVVSYIVAGTSEVVFHNALGIADHILAILGVVDLSALLDDGIVQESLGTVAGDDGPTVVHERRKAGILVVCIIS